MIGKIPPKKYATKDKSGMYQYNLKFSKSSVREHAKIDVPPRLPPAIPAAEPAACGFVDKFLLFTRLTS